MTSLTVLRRGRLAGAVIPALGIAIAGLTVASAGAQAASRNPAHAALHGGPKVALGTTTNVFANVFNEGPDGSLYYSRGAVVYRVIGVTINTYNATTLAQLSSRKISNNAENIAGDSLGLVVEVQVCGKKCSPPTFSKLNAGTGAVSGTIKLPGAAILLPGPSAGVIEVNHGFKGSMALQRLS